MKLHHTIAYSWLIVLTLSACKKSSLGLYDQEKSGSSIYFPEAVGTTTSKSLLKTISFGYVGYSKKDSVLTIPIAATGDTSNTDRPVKLTFTSATTAVEGTHYTFLRTPVIRAGKVTDTLYLKLIRTTDMTTKQFEIDLALEANDYFSTKLHDTTANYLSYKVLVDDIAGKSYLWVSYSNTKAIVNYFGDYSRKKVDLILEVLGLDPALFYDPVNSSSITSSKILAWSRYMAFWLNQEANAGRIYLDENGVRITMGALAG